MPGVLKKTWEITKQGLLDIMNMYREGQITDRQKYGIIACIPKQAKPMCQEDYRTLTLLNTLQISDLDNSKPPAAMVARYTGPGPALWPTGHHGLRGACDNTRCSGICRRDGYPIVLIID